MHGLYDWMISWAESPYSVHALFILAVAEATFFPIPVDVLLIAMGLVAPDQALWFALVCTVGSVVGGMGGYGIGRYGGKPVLERFVAHEKIARIHSYFEKYEAWAIGIAGFTPVPYKIFTIAAGVFWINFFKFVVVSFVSRGARFFLVGGLIMVFGEEIRGFIGKYFNILSLAFVVLLAGGFYVVHHQGKKASRHEGDTGREESN